MPAIWLLPDYFDDLDDLVVQDLEALVVDDVLDLEDLVEVDVVDVVVVVGPHMSRRVVTFAPSSFALPQEANAL